MSIRSLSSNYRFSNELSSPARHVAVLIGVCLLLTGTASAQPQVEHADVVFQSLNGTTGEPCVLDRLELKEHTVMAVEVGTAEPGTSVFTLGQVPLVDARAYIATAWFQEVPYYWEFRGRFLDQDTNTIHVFDTTRETKNVVVSGLNLIFQKQGDLVSLEYILEVDNRALPQVAVVGTTSIFELMVPEGITDLEAEVHRGPEPTAVRLQKIGQDRLGLNVPLVPGKNRIQLKMKMEWKSNLEIPVGCDLPIEAWSLLGSPDYLEFVSFELENDPDNALQGVSRFIGPHLDAGREITIRVNADAAPAPEGDLFTATDSTAAAESDDESEDNGGSKVPIPLLAMAMVLIILIAVVRRRQKSKD